ncbi:MAG: nucleotidyltransferase family protein [Burkholderiales bacterium]|nr:nucleotidyltransferase family protein [Burkholderiales bacterium]
MRVGVMLLGAGRASRMGGPNKLLLRIDGEPMITRAARALAALQPADWVVVLGRDADEVAAAVQAGAAEWAAAAPAAGPRWCRVAAGLEQPASVMAGLRSLSAPLDAIVIMLGDQPLVDTADLRWLIGQWQCLLPGSVLVPCHGGVRGNPVVFDARLRAAIIEADDGRGVRGFLDANPQRVHKLEAPNEHFVFDVDTPADLRRLAERGHRVAIDLAGTPGSRTGGHGVDEAP